MTQTEYLAMQDVDPVTLELIKGAIRSARKEMEALIDRTSMSPFIREKKDYFTAYFDRRGNLVSSTDLPMAGNLIDCILEHYPAETLRPGDLYWYNDAYGSRGAVSHLPDMVFVAPVFHDAELFAFAEAWGHLWDIGGMMPGSISPDATDIFQEGIVMPPVRIYSGGVLNREVLRIFLRNSRFPEMVKGDLSAIMAACRLGRKRLEEIVQRFGVDAVTGAFEFTMRQSEAALRKAIADRIPDGHYGFRDWLDSDAVSDRGYSVHVSLTKRGDEVSLDFTGSDDQAAGAVNFIMDDTVPAFMCGLYLTLADPSIEMNAGFARAIREVRTRPGSLVNPNPPAPLGMRSHTMIRVNSALFGALAQATRGQCSAASCVYVLYYLRSYDDDRGDFDLCIEGLAVGFGARPSADGIDAVYYVAQKNYPVEFAEMEFGVRVEGYAIHTDSGGPGRYRGGCGIVRDVRVISDAAVLGLRMDNVKYPAWGVNGGHGGRPGRVVVNPGTPEERQLRPLSDMNRLKKGDLVRIVTAGGGGWGSPLERPAAQVRDDVLDGFISRASARDDYGVVLDDHGLEVDRPATEALRRRLAGPTGMYHRRGYFDGEEPRAAAE
jgi:N-methylhydantoinase B